jgi:SagB-type dehydrogenase family enzyme
VFQHAAHLRRGVIHWRLDNDRYDERTEVGSRVTSPNRETKGALAFHNASKYRVIRDETGEECFVIGSPPDPDSAAYEEDPALLPLPYKMYETLAPIPLPHDLPPTTLPGLEALSRTGASLSDAGEAVVDLAAIARIALLSNGLLGRTHTNPHQQRTVEYRTAGGTGALYHLELYFICADLPDLPAGIYHYAAHDHSLRRLRTGDFRRILVEASGSEPALAEAPAILAITSTFWRNAWYYRVRAYRHTYWDSGTELSHVFAVAAALNLPVELALGYDDAHANALLGVDGQREAVVALCALGSGGAPAPSAPSVTPLDLPTRPLSAHEYTFSSITTMHQASSLISGEEAAEWRAARLRRNVPVPKGPLTQLRPLPEDSLPAMSLEELVFKRRSARHYDPELTVSFSSFSTLLDRSSRGCAADCLSLDTPPLHDLYLIVHDVEGLADGIYLHHPHLHAVELLREGLFRDQATRIALDQEYAGTAQVNCYYLTDLAPVLQCYGNRGYRIAQLECALYAGKLQLAAHALGLGTVGSTSYDDEVIEFFSPHASGKAYMFVVVFGSRRQRGS